MVTDKNILEDVEAYLDALDQLIGDFNTNDSFCRMPNYKKLIGIFGFTDEHLNKKYQIKRNILNYYK